MDKELAKNLQPGEFLIGDFTSAQLFSKIEKRPIIEKPNRKVTASEIDFRSGSVLFDSQSYSNTEMVLELFFEAKTEEERDLRRDLITFAFDTGSYQTFVPYFDKKKIYMVHTVSAPKFEGYTVNGNSERYTVTFTVKPFKILTNNEEVEIKNGGKVINQSLYPSLPIIKIEGKGDVNLKVNGKSFVLKDIQESIVIDSGIPTVYRIPSPGEYAVNEERKAYTRKFPFLVSGSNTISWTGTLITRVIINPRWWSL